jgi:hypothetical protein
MLFTLYGKYDGDKRIYYEHITELPTSGKKENPPHVQAHLILLVPHKIKRAFTSPPPPKWNNHPENLDNHPNFIYLCQTILDK